MIAPLRRRHRWMVIGLGLVLVPLFAAAMLVKMQRTAMPSANALPDAAPTKSPDGPGIHFALRADAAGGAAAHGFHYEASIHRTGGTFELKVRPQTDLLVPDVLAYYADEASVGDGIPDRATLLGALQSEEHGFALPSASNGMLYFYSLAQRRIIARVDLSRLRMEVRDNHPTPAPEDL